MQMAIIKSYQDERERAKMPGYVCTYDDYDGGDFDYESPSYAGMVTGQKNGFRAHGGHPAGSRTHLNTPEKGAVSRKGDEPFGAGL